MLASYKSSSSATIVNPVLVANDKIIDIAFGEYYSFYVNAEGKLYAWGYNRDGNDSGYALLHNPYDNRNKLQQGPMYLMSNVKEVQSEGYLTCALSKDNGRIWGGYLNGVVYMNNKEFTEENGIKIVEIGANHCYKVKEDSIYIKGTNNYGEFGEGGKTKPGYQDTKWYIFGIDASYESSNKDEEINLTALELDNAGTEEIVIEGTAVKFSETGLEEGKIYNVYASSGEEISKILSDQELLYAGQYVADANGSISQTIHMMEECEGVNILISGGKLADIATANVTNTTLDYNGEELWINPTLILNGITLIHGQDYVLKNQVIATEPGEYQAYAVGIGNYSGRLPIIWSIHKHSIKNHYEKTDSTCEKEGKQEYWECECGKIFTDKELFVAVSEEQLIIPKKEHSCNKGKMEREPDDTLTGIWRMECENCDYYKDISTYLVHLINENSVYKDIVVKETEDLISLLPVIEDTETRRFVGWSLSENSSEVLDADTEVVLETGMRLYAKWEEKAQVEAIIPSITDGSCVLYNTVLYLDTSTEGANIYYTLDGSNPDTSSTDSKTFLYTDEGITITSNITIKAVAVKENCINSEILQVSYTLTYEESDWGDIAVEDRNLFESPFMVPESLWVAGIDENGYTYQGTGIKPQIRVYDNKTLLINGRDYTVSYKNNKNAYTKEVGETGFQYSKAPKITVKGKGNYSGIIVKYFVISPLDISTALVKNTTLAYSSKKRQKAVIPVKYELNGKLITLKNKVDYILEYPDTDEGSVIAYKTPGEYTITIIGKGNYTGETETTEVITKAKLIQEASVSEIADQPYTGSAIIPEKPLTVKYGKKKLTEGRDYTVTYTNNINVGTAKATITGMGEYAGEKTVTFKITGTKISNFVVKGVGDVYTYSGEEIRPSDTEEFKAYAKNTPDKPLKEGDHYKVTYTRNVNVGTATLTITGINGYTGTIKKQFKIKPYSVKQADDSRITVLDIGEKEYQKNGVCPTVTVMDGEKTLVLGKDYAVTYMNNKTANDTSKQPYVKISGKGNYGGSRKVYFTILPKDISTTVMTATDIVWKKKANICQPVITIKDNGKKLIAGTDYNKKIKYTYKDSGLEVGKNDIILSGTVITATATGKGNYYESISVDFRFVNRDIAKAKASVPSQKYTGVAIELSEVDLEVKYPVGKKWITLVRNTDYEVVSYQNNTNKGTAKVIIKGIGQYGGMKTISYKITSRSMNYTIIYDKNAEDAKGIMKKSLISTGSKLENNVYTRKGYTFLGWNTKPDGTGYFYKNRETFRIKSIFQIFGTKQVLYAQWKANDDLS